MKKLLFLCFILHSSFCLSPAQPVLRQFATTNSAAALSNAISAISRSALTNQPLVLNLTNAGFATNPASAYYGDYGKLVLGTNMSGGDVGATVLVPNFFRMQQADGSYFGFWPYPGHGGGGLAIVASQRDISLVLGPGGNLQLGKSGGQVNEEVTVQYNDEVGYSGLFNFATKVGSAYHKATIHSRAAGSGSEAILNFYSDSPVWNAPYTSNFLSEGHLVFQMETNGVNIRGRNVNARSTSSSATVAVDFSSGLLQDVSPSASAVTFSITGNDGGITNLVRKIVYLRSGGQALSLTWPSGVNVLGETVTNLPSTLAPALLLRTEWEAVGPGNTNVQVSLRTGADNSFAWDADAAAFFTAASITDATQKSAVNTFVAARKAHGTWTTADRIAVFVGGNSTAHSKYLKGSGTISFTGSPTHNTNGVTFNGSSQFADSGFTPNTDGVNFTVNSDRLLVYVSTNSAYPIAANGAFAAVSATTYTGILFDGSSLFSYGNNAVAGSSGMSFVQSDCRGVLGTTRTAASTGGLYLNLQALAGGTLTATALPTATITMGCRRWGTGGGDIDRYAAYTCCGFEVGAGVDTTTWNSIRADWLALNQALNR